MTDPEWDAIAMLIGSTFIPTQEMAWTESRSAAYRLALADHDAGALLAAIRTLHRTGQRFLPAVADIVAAADPAPPVPPATVMGHELGRAMRRYGRDRRDEAIRHLTNVHPLLGAFAAKEGWGRLCSLPLLDPQFGELERNRLGQRWVDWTEHAQHLDRDQLAAAAVERGRLTGPRRLDPAALLPGSEAAA